MDAVPHQHLERLFTLSPDLLCVASLDGYFLHVNPALERTLGYDAATLRSAHFLEFVHPDDHDASLRELRRLADGLVSFRFKNRYRTAGGDYVWLEWTADADPDDGLVYAVARDMTDQVTAEQALTRYADSLERAQTDLRAAIAELEHTAGRDALTGLANRRGVEDAAEDALSECAGGERPLSVVLFDVDRFKSVNDSWGHDAGDTVLREIARRVSAAVRQDDHVGRWGGDEILVILPGASAAVAEAIAARIVRNVGARGVETAAGTVPVTISGGVVTANVVRGVDGLRTLLAHADDALREAKRQGRDRVLVAQPASRAQVA
jgi:diguanylate cyclase (GGDEF)-like protein/PAS domain S-box-containing protein